MQEKDSANAKQAECPDIAQSGAAGDTIKSIDEHAIRLSIKSSSIYNPEDGVYVGLLHELPPPDVLEEDWYSIRNKLTIALLRAGRELSKSGKASQERFEFEPEFCMSGRALADQQHVLLKPTIWISCRSVEHQRYIKDAIKNLDYTRRFPVHVTKNAPQPASRRSFTRASPCSGEESDDTQSYEMSGAIRRVDGYLRKNGDQIEISVQHFSSNHYSACGLEIKIRVAGGIEYVCRLGGLIHVNGTILGLTTAHAIPQLSRGDRLYVDSLIHESLFIFNAHSEELGISAEPPLEISSSTTTKLSATLWSAEYGVSSSIPTPNVPRSSHSSITLDEDMCDFALLQIDFGQQKKPKNSYRNAHGVQIVERETDDLKGRVVDVVCSYKDVRSGWLLAGERIIVSDAGCWKTRKIQLEKPLGKISPTPAPTQSSGSLRYFFHLIKGKI
jgi:hypothetical protein